MQATIANVSPDDVAKQEEQSGKDLILRRRAEPLLDGQMGQKSVDFRLCLSSLTLEGKWRLHYLWR